MPVVSPDGQLIGLVSVDDLVELVGRELHHLGEAVLKEMAAGETTLT